MATDAFLFLAIVCFALAGLALLLPVPCNHKDRPGCPTCERDAIARRERRERSEHQWHSTSWGPTYRDAKCPYCRGNRE